MCHTVTPLAKKFYPGAYKTKWLIRNQKEESPDEIKERPLYSVAHKEENTIKCRINKEMNVYSRA